MVLTRHYNRDLFHLSEETFVFVGLLLMISLYFFSFTNQYLPDAQAKSSNSDGCDRKDSNIIVGTRPVTLGTECNDVVIGCPTIASATGLGSPCGNGNILRGFEKDDVLQGSVGNDEIYGDEGNDELVGSSGSDKLYGGPGIDILQAGDGPDLLIGANEMMNSMEVLVRMSQLEVKVQTILIVETVVM